MDEVPHDQSLAASIDEAIGLLPPDMTPAERTKAAQDFAFDYALKATFGTTFDELASKASKRATDEELIEIIGKFDAGLPLTMAEQTAIHKAAEAMKKGT
jgi:hypothetical protein